MADITKIKINDTTYNVKDANAFRSSGGTVSGNVTITGGCGVENSMSIRGTGKYIDFRNDDNKSCGGILTDSNNRIYLRSWNVAKSHYVNAYLPIPDNSETANSTKQIPLMTATTTAQTAGTSKLTTNCICLVYE